MAAKSQDKESRSATEECADAERARALLDDQLDEALKGTFPASDPVSLNIPHPCTSPRGERHRIRDRDRKEQDREEESAGGREKG